MLIIHCADVHLDASYSSKAGLDKNLAKSRNTEILNTFCRMVDFADQNNVEAILICGDLFDVTKATTGTLNELIGKIQSTPGITFFYLKGNHDAVNMFDGKRSVPANLVTFDDNWKSTPLGNRVVITGAELTNDNAQKLPETLKLDEEKINIVMMHGDANASVRECKGETIALKRYRNKLIDYLALGHIHEPSHNEKLDDRGIYNYSGCLEGRGFDETGDHGFYLLDIDETTGKITPVFHDIAFRKTHVVNVDVTGSESMVEMQAKVDKKLADSDIPSKDLIEVVLTGDVDPEIDINLEQVRLYLQPNYYFVKMKNSVKILIDYKKFENDISLKGEFIRMVKDDDTLSDDEKLEVIKRGLNALAGREIY